MTLKDYKTEHLRLIEALRSVDPTEEDRYFSILHCIGGLDSMAIQHIDASERLKYYENDEAADSAEADNVVALPVMAPKTTPKRKSKSEEHPVEQPFPEPEPEPEPEAEKSKPEPAISTEEEKPLTLAEVKTAFTAAAKSGVKVAEIINDTGYAKLSEIPDYLYPALMRSLERKKAGEE